jgi:hypothetical protein
MSITKKISVVFGVLAVIASAIVLLFVYAVRTNVASRVPIPGSSMSAVVTADVSGCYSCQLFDQGHPISDLLPLGPYASRSCSLEHISSVSNIVTIEWADGYHYSVMVDIASRRFIVGSNSVPSK